jgi:hypothetical protein
MPQQPKNWVHSFHYPERLAGAALICTTPQALPDALKPVNRIILKITQQTSLVAAENPAKMIF